VFHNRGPYIENDLCAKVALFVKGACRIMPRVADALVFLVKDFIWFRSAEMVGQDHVDI